MDKKCLVCSGELPTKRHTYCAPCAKDVQSQASRNKGKRRLKGCLTCGGPNEGRGSRYCEPCREKKLPVWAQAENERSRRRRVEAAKERELVGKECLGCNSVLDSARKSYCDACIKSRSAEKARIRRSENPDHQKELNKVRSEKKKIQKIEAGSKPKIVDDTKWCTKCESYKKFTDFGTNSSMSTGLQTYCIVCSSIYGWERRLKSIYGITPEEYDEIFKSQDGKCAICHNKPKKIRLAVDHDHKSGLVRGLLCTHCNHKLLGAAHDNIEILNRAVEYLTTPPAALLNLTVPEKPKKTRKTRTS